MNQNGTGKMQVTCPGCKTVFSLKLPHADIINTLHSSSVIAVHERLSRCIACGQSFVMIVAGVQLSWGAQPVGSDVVEQMEGSKIIKPDLLIPK